MIQATVIGRLTRDPETKTVGNSTVTKFSVASNNYTKGDGESSATYVTCNLWGKRGEAVQNNFSKGDGIIVFGTLEVRTYDAGDGKGIKTSLDCNVTEFQFPQGKVAADSVTLVGAAAKAKPASAATIDDYDPFAD